MKTYGGVDIYIHVYLTLALIGGEWSASRPDSCTPGERVPVIHWIGGWVGPIYFICDEGETNRETCFYLKTYKKYLQSVIPAAGTVMPSASADVRQLMKPL
jgi:hypothetical protein